MAPKIIGTFQLPRTSNKYAVILTLKQKGEEFTMANGKFGPASVTTTDKSRVAAHWSGYVSNNLGTTVTIPAEELRFQA